jgi:hypothetical protein
LLKRLEHTSAKGDLLYSIYSETKASWNTRLHEIRGYHFNSITVMKNIFCFTWKWDCDLIQRAGRKRNVEIRSFLMEKPMFELYLM